MGNLSYWGGNCGYNTSSHDDQEERSALLKRKGKERKSRGRKRDGPIASDI